VGFSLGGTIVLWAAAERPDLVVHPIPMATSSIVGRAAAGYFAGRIAQLEAGDHAGFAAGLHDDTAHQALTNVALDERVARRLEAVGSGQGYINAATAMMRLRDTPLTPRLTEIESHVDVIGADRDMFCPRKAADIMVEALPNATYHEIAGSGHLIAVDQPEALISLLATLLKTSQSSSS
jgi:pimeloyl-ACP methyl ester carboxylesterase